MIPILYKPEEVWFETMGIGPLTDAVSCVVTEGLNSSFELVLKYPVDGVYFHDITYRSIILAKPNGEDNTQPFRVYKKLTSNTNSIYIPISNRFCTDFRIHSTRTNNRNIYKFLNMCYILKVAVLRHIHRRMSPIPRVICTVISIQHIIADILQILCSLFGFFHVTTHFNIFFARHCSVAEIL